MDVQDSTQRSLNYVCASDSSTLLKQNSFGDFNVSVINPSTRALDLVRSFKQCIDEKYKDYATVREKNINLEEWKKEEELFTLFLEKLT